MNFSELLGLSPGGGSHLTCSSRYVITELCYIVFYCVVVSTETSQSSLSDEVQDSSLVQYSALQQSDMLSDEDDNSAQQHLNRYNSRKNIPLTNNEVS